MGRKQLELKPRYGSLTVLGRTANHKVRCRCDCGNEVYRTSTQLRHGTRSCGCKHPKAINHSDHPLYPIWAYMNGVCYNENHKQYPSNGGKGIKVVQRWQTFRNFVADVGERPAGHVFTRMRLDQDFGPDNWYWLESSRGRQKG